MDEHPHDWVDTQIRQRGIHSPEVLRAMRTVPREAFIPDADASLAHADAALSIGEGQTISQPYIVALMTDLAWTGPGCRILDVGTGSGYQAAILAELGAEVFSIEIKESLSERAARVLKRLGYDQVHLRVGDGAQGWEEEAPFDGIIVAACARHIPAALKQQLKVNGSLIIPVGGANQELVELVRVGEDEFETRDVLPVRFVPLTGEG